MTSVFLLITSYEFQCYFMSMLVKGCRHMLELKMLLHSTGTAAEEEEWEGWIRVHNAHTKWIHLFMQKFLPLFIKFLSKTNSSNPQMFGHDITIKMVLSKSYTFWKEYPKKKKKNLRLIILQFETQFRTYIEEMFIEWN